MPEEPVAATEKKFQSLRLTNAGGDTLEKGHSTIVWSICGDFYLLFQKKDQVLDAVKLPAMPEKDLPVASACKRKGETIAGVLPVLKAGAAEQEPNVQQAWRLDYRQGKLVPLPPDGLVCPPP